MVDVRLATHSVTRQFSNGSGIKEVSVAIGASEIVALIGLNGAGKTTLMRVMLGMLRPSAGLVEINGQPIAQAPSQLWAQVGHLVEQPLAYPELTVRQNLQLAARLHRLNDPAIIDCIMDELVLNPYSARQVRALSLGNRQRVGLAAALMHDPQVIILDEPTNGLDPAGIIALQQALQRRAAAGAAVLVSSHHLDEVSRIAQRILVMNAGHIIGSIKPGKPDLERTFFELVRQDDEQRKQS